MRKFRGWRLAAVLALLLLTACGEKPQVQSAAADPLYIAPEKPVQSELPPRLVSPETEQRPPEAERQPEPPPYDFGVPLAEHEPVEDSRFDDAVFLGDSRTEGLQLFSGLKHGSFFWLRDAVLYRGELPKYALFGDGEEKVTMLRALEQKEYGAVYVFTGLNELERPPEYFREKLAAFLDRVLELQPRAVVYLQTVLPVNEEAVRSSGLRDCFTNEGVDAFNDVIRQLAAEKQVVLLDTAEIYRGEDGQLPGEMTSDGCHFKPKYYRLWAEYLRTHVMEPEMYHQYREQEQTT